MDLRPTATSAKTRGQQLRMRTIAYEAVVQAVIELCEETLFHLREDIQQALEQASEREDTTGKVYIELLLQNIEQARREQLPLSQDTGLPLFFVEQGDVEIEGGTLVRAIEEGLRSVQERQSFHTSLVHEPYASQPEATLPVRSLLHLTETDEEVLTLRCFRSDARSEKTSVTKQLLPPHGKNELIAAVLEVVEQAGPESSPPLIVGIGLGATTAHVGLLARQALFRPIGKPHRELDYARLEQDLFDAINETGLGPGGLGGQTTTLAVHIEAAPCHQALVPICVQLQSHVLRVGERNL